VVEAALLPAQLIAELIGTQGPARGYGDEHSVVMVYSGEPIGQPVAMGARS
jgi:hypothetical protein